MRAGVAPDHPKIKSVTRMYEKTAQHPGFRFFGGVELGAHVGRQDLLERYHCVLYAVGTAVDNRLGIPGEDRPGSHAATEFVAWYNGHPDYADHEFDLSATRAVVIGNGNVAVDVARMLVLDPDEVSVTDTADHAVGPLAAAQVQDVIMLGRRGPAQAAFTNPELRELGELTRADVIVDPDRWSSTRTAPTWLESEGDADQQAQRRDPARLLAARAARPRPPRRAALPALAGGDPRRGRGRPGHRHPRRQEPDRERPRRRRPARRRSSPAGSCSARSATAACRWRASRSTTKRGLIRNEGGRVTGDGGEHECGEYVVGWVKRGPSGVIGTNKKDAADTVAKVLEDREAGRLNTPTERARRGLVRRALPGARHLGGLARDRRARDRAAARRRAARASSSCARAR